MRKRTQRNLILAAAVAIVIAGIFILPRLHFPQSHPKLVPQIATSTPSSSKPKVRVVPKKLTTYPYIEVVDSCGPHYEGTCVDMRSGPATSSPVVARLRTGVVLKVADTVEENGQTWYIIDPGADVKYPERITTAWYISADAVKLFQDVGDQDLTKDTPKTNKKIVVSIDNQMLYAYDGDTLYMETPVSTGLELTPTPRGTFTVFRMTPSRYMQGPIPGLSDQYYDLPGVPWDLYFTKDGAVIHGAYWHNSFGEKWSHGCVNLPLDESRKLYEWAVPGTEVVVRN